MKAAEYVQPWVVPGAADHAAAAAVAVAVEDEEEPGAVEAAVELVVAEVAEVRAASKRNATALISQLTFRTFLTTQISVGRSAI
jgi:hypothetical protein